MHYEIGELRFLLTQKCNYACDFCHREGEQTKKKDLLTPEDYSFLFRVGEKYLKWETTTLSGGEPLLRKDIIEVARNLHNQGAKITLVTNGFWLSEKIQIGEYIERINLSLHTLNKCSYESIVGKKESLDKIINNIIAYRAKYPNAEIRLNATMIKGLNTDQEEIDKLMNFAERINASVKLIELFPPSAEKFVPLTRIKSALMGKGFVENHRKRKSEVLSKNINVLLTKCCCAEAKNQKNPAEYCKKNSDLYISPDGKIKPCRYDRSEVDLMKEIKERDFEGIAKKIEFAISLITEEKCKGFLECI